MALFFSVGERHQGTLHWLVEQATLGGCWLGWRRTCAGALCNWKSGRREGRLKIPEQKEICFIFVFGSLSRGCIFSVCFWFLELFLTWGSHCNSLTIEGSLLAPCRIEGLERGTKYKRSKTLQELLPYILCQVSCKVKFKYLSCLSCLDLNDGSLPIHRRTNG